MLHASSAGRRRRIQFDLPGPHNTVNRLKVKIDFHRFEVLENKARAVLS